MKPIELTIGKQTLSIANWAKITGLNRNTIRERIKSGWSPEQCIGREPPPWRINHLGPRPRQNKLREPVELKMVVQLVEVTDHTLTGRAAREIRNKAGLSMDQAAESLGWSIGRIYEMENGRTKWQQKHVEHFNTVAATWVAQKEKSNEEL